MTYSILGLDPSTKQVGIAVQSKFPGVGSIIAHGRAGVGVIATQGFANPDHGPKGLELLQLGALPEQVMGILLTGDEDRDQRQIAIMNLRGSVAAYVGKECLSWKGWAGSKRGPHCIAHGNSLVDEHVIDQMVSTFEADTEDLPTRLINALLAGEEAGGELRGQQSAALLVVKEGGGYGGRSGREVDISIYDHKQPIAELKRCYALHRLSYFPSDPEDLIPIDKNLAQELKRILIQREFLPETNSIDWDGEAISAMQRFMGHENYDNRIRSDAKIDTEVLMDIRKKYKQWCRDNAR